MSSININMEDILRASSEINEEVAQPYKDNEEKFFETISEFTTLSFVSNSSKIKAQQILKKKEYLDSMYKCMIDYSNFLHTTAAEFRNADNRAVDAFHNH